MATKPTAPQIIEIFNYELSRAAYMTQIKKCFDEDSTHSDTTIQKTINILKGPVKTYLHKNYEVSYEFGHEILVEKVKLSDEPEVQVVQVLSFGDVFDIFIKYHTGNNHVGGSQYLLDQEKNFKCRYNYPTICLTLLVKSCNVCKKKSRKSPKSLNNISSVYVTVMMQKKYFTDFKYILMYIDKATDFVLLRPLRQKTDVEVSMEIFKIMTQFGPPQKLCLHGYNIDFNKKIGVLLRQVCPMFSFSIEYKSDNLDPSAFVVNMLQEWMTRNNTAIWEIGCSVVQKKLNTEIKQKIPSKGNMDLSPFDLFYGKTPKTKSRKTKTTKKTDKNNDDDVVELRIPSPDNYNVDPLSQFEDSENSTELDLYIAAQKGEKVKSRRKRGTKIKSTTKPNKKLPKDSSKKRTVDNDNEKQKKTNLSKIMPKDLHSEDVMPDEIESPVVTDRKKSLRSTKNANYKEENFEDKNEGSFSVYAMDEELIYDPDDAEDTEDPLIVNENELEQPGSS